MEYADIVVSFISDVYDLLIYYPDNEFGMSESGRKISRVCLSLFCLVFGFRQVFDI